MVCFLLENGIRADNVGWFIRPLWRFFFNNGCFVQVEDNAVLYEPFRVERVTNMSVGLSSIFVGALSIYIYIAPTSGPAIRRSESHVPPPPCCGGHQCPIFVFEMLTFALLNLSCPPFWGPNHTPHWEQAVVAFSPQASAVNYPPISPSTLPPGGGVACSPSESAIGALRRAEMAANAHMSRGGEAAGGLDRRPAVRFLLVYLKFIWSDERRWTL